MRAEPGDVRNILRFGGVALALAGGCADGESTSGEAAETARDQLAEELGATLCEGASWCCASFGYDAPGEACRTSMRNAVMIQIIEAEDDARTLVPERIEPCLRTFDGAIAAAVRCEDIPVPAELLDRCPDLFTPASAIAARETPPCPHDEDTCGEPPHDGPDCADGSCWTLVFENVCR